MNKETCHLKVDSWDLTWSDLALICFIYIHLSWFHIHLSWFLLLVFDWTRLEPWHEPWCHLHSSVLWVSGVFMWGLQRRWFLKRGRSSTLLASQRSKAVFLKPLAVHDLCDMWTTHYFSSNILFEWNSFYSNVLPKRSLLSVATLRKDLKRLNDHCFLTGQPRAHHREECGELRRNHVSIRMHLMNLMHLMGCQLVAMEQLANSGGKLDDRSGKSDAGSDSGGLQRSGIDWSESYIMIYIIYNLDYHLIRWYIYIYTHNLCNDTPRAGHKDWRRKLCRDTENRVGLGLRIHRKKHRKKHQIHLWRVKNLLESVRIWELSWVEKPRVAPVISGCSSSSVAGRLWPLRSWNSQVRYASTPVRPLGMSPWVININSHHVALKEIDILKIKNV